MVLISNQPTFHNLLQLVLLALHMVPSYFAISSRAVGSSPTAQERVSFVWTHIGTSLRLQRCSSAELSYRWMFDCCRIPGLQGLDWSVSHASANADELGHIIVTRKNRFWKIKGIVDNRILSMTELEKWVLPVSSSASILTVPLDRYSIFTTLLRKNILESAF